MVRKLLIMPILIVAACVIAGLYGIIHNQISFTVSPEYFYDFKFIQFAVHESIPARIAAALVGLQASWWMGVVIGLPICLLALTVRSFRGFIYAFLLAVPTVVAVTLLVGLAGLIFGFVTIHEANLPYWMAGWDVSDPVAFARAGTMHNFSYLGGLLGLIAGIVVVIRKSIASRKSAAG